MAYNPSPKIKMDRDYAEKFDQQQVIIIAVDNNLELSYTSYGKTKYLCQVAKDLADTAFNAILKKYNGD